MKAYAEALRAEGLAAYPRGAAEALDTRCAIVREGEEKWLAVQGRLAGEFGGTPRGEALLCPLTADNARALMHLFPWAAPRAGCAGAFSFGMGDRLGDATPGHVQALAGHKVFPVFAQQSMRELKLTGRSYADVVAAAAFGVFQAGWQSGYGADGDHLKTAEEIDYALDSGCTMITLDCSEHIDDAAAGLDGEQIAQRYAALPEAFRSRFEQRYFDKELPVVGMVPAPLLRKTAVVFGRAVAHAGACWRHIQKRGAQVDFELSIDETLSSTAPHDHFIIAAELYAEGVEFTSAAPHFYGAFEKGIDYRGDVARFAEELAGHQRIADHFGYKLSLHSGSDKFAVFPDFGRVTAGVAHVKTAGTSWLEAVRVVAKTEPALFRRTLEYAIDNRPAAEQYYHVSTRAADIVPPATRVDAELPRYLDEDAARQTLHITYGLLLEQGWFKAPLFGCLARNEEAYYGGLAGHLGRHLAALLGARG